MTRWTASNQSELHTVGKTRNLSHNNTQAYLLLKPWLVGLWQRPHLYPLARPQAIVLGSFVQVACSMYVVFSFPIQCPLLTSAIDLANVQGWDVLQLRRWTSEKMFTIGQAGSVTMNATLSLISCFICCIQWHHQREPHWTFLEQSPGCHQWYLL